MVNAACRTALLFLVFAVAFAPGAFGADAVVDRDTAIVVAKAACGSALDLPVTDHPRWDAQMLDDHWSARLMSDYAPYFDDALVTVDVARDGTTSDCIVYVHP